jgi:hypothetical protein
MDLDVAIAAALTRDTVTCAAYAARWVCQFIVFLHAFVPFDRKLMAARFVRCFAQPARRSLMSGRSERGGPFYFTELRRNSAAHAPRDRRLDGR